MSDQQVNYRVLCLLCLICLLIQGCGDGCNSPTQTIEPALSGEAEDQLEENAGLYEYAINKDSHTITFNRWNDQKKETYIFRESSVHHVYLIEKNRAFVILSNNLLIGQNKPGSSQPIFMALPPASFKAESAPADKLWIDINSSLPLYRDSAKQCQNCKITNLPGNKSQSSCIYSFEQESRATKCYGFSFPGGCMVWDCIGEQGTSKGIALSAPCSKMDKLAQLNGLYSVITSSQENFYGTAKIVVKGDDLQFTIKYLTENSSISIKGKAEKAIIEESGIIQLTGLDISQSEEKMEVAFIPIWQDVLLYIAYPKQQKRHILQLGFFIRK